MNWRDKILALFLAIAFGFAPAATMTSGVKAGYWPSYLNSTFPASSIKFPFFTHVYYAFVQPHPTAFDIIVTPFDAQVIPSFVAAAHAHRVKAMLTVGGGNSNVTTFANLASAKTARAAFILSSIATARKFGLDGLDLDWEFPANSDQMSHLGDLFTEWRAAIDREAATSGLSRLLLTSAVYFASSFILAADTRPYPAMTMDSKLDWINVMCFDYHGGWDTTKTGALAALYDPTSNVSTSFGIESWIRAGVRQKNVVMGMPLYGRSWNLKSPEVNGMGAPAVAVGPGDGVMIYSVILQFNKNNSATRVFDKKTVSTYSYSGISWIGYDNPKSVQTKVEFAKARELRGYFFWALGYEDKHWSISAAASSTWHA